MSVDELLIFDYEASNKKTKVNPFLRMATIIFAAAFIFVMLPLISRIGFGSGAFTAHAASPVAIGKTTDVVNVRKAATTSSASLGTVRKGTSLNITSEVFTGKSNTSLSSRWYYVSGGGKKGYVRADLVSKVTYKSVNGFTTDDLNYRAGAGTSMKRIATAASGTNIKVCLPAKASDGSKWYRVTVGKKTGYMSAEYLSIGGKAGNSYESRLTAAPTRGGKARYVGTLDSSNCRKVFSVKGDGDATVPQGMAYTGSRYYIIYGMGYTSQRIVTYSSNGKRLNSSKFAFNIGKPNAVTWNPATKKCYIFKGSQKTIYTWDPATNKYGKATTPYSSSGIAYDNKTKKLCASSLTGIRIYSADGKFNQLKRFDRCSHGVGHYVQDCGAGNGVVIHALSGSNKFSTNYLDFYRISDGKYLGSFKVYLGELESVIVDNNGYVQLLVNHGGTYTDWIWKTPINVKKIS